MKLLKKIPFFPFLLVLFFCLHGSVENYGYVGLAEVSILGLGILFFVAVFSLLVMLFTRNYIFAALITFFVSLWYLFFGAMQDWIRSHHFLAFLNRYTVMLPLLLLITVAWIIFLKKKKNLHGRFVYYLNLLMLIYCAIDGFGVLQKYFTPEKKSAFVVDFNKSKVISKPNVYYLLFDEYPGYQSLKDSFGYSNDSLYHFLQNRNFSILPTFSNYDFTFFSMSSILNMHYVEKDYDPLNITQRTLQLRLNEIRNASVVGIFEDMGYEFRNYSIFDVAGQHAVSDHNDFLPVHSILLTDKILHNRIIRHSGWLIQKFPLWKKKYMYQHEKNNNYSEEMVLKTSLEKNSKPFFCYSHFVLPHGPFYRDSTGRRNTDAQIDDTKTWSRELYFSYVKYANIFIRALVEKLVSNDPGAIIVVMSDHGYRSFKNTRPYEPFNYDNICAVRFPDKNYPVIREKWSNVNFFRYLFNSQFGQSMPYLADSSIVLQYQQ